MGLFLVNERMLISALVVLVIAGLAFALLVKYYNRIQSQYIHLKNMVLINQQELMRLENDYKSIGDGHEFYQKGHPYASDLDLFGENSIFQFINRTSTIFGREQLSQLLLSGTTRNGILENHAAVKELADYPEWCQHYQAYGLGCTFGTKERASLQEWLSQEPAIRWSLSLKMSRIIAPLLFVAVIAYCYLTSTTYYLVLPFIIINGVVLAMYWKRTTEVVEMTSGSLVLLKALKNQIRMVVTSSFSSGQLAAFRKFFLSEENNAGNEIMRLQRMLDQLESRRNMLHIFINLPLLLDIHWMYQLEHWKRKNKDHIVQWFESLGKLEVLISFSGIDINNSNWVFPIPSDDPFQVEATDMGHPLIDEAKRKYNDYSSIGKGKISVLTGPNMAGKSTFLRTLAVNLVMAKMGAPVCAKKFLFDPELHVFAAMRVADDLSESVSSFYAELERIRQLLEIIEKGISVFFVLDEVLKGTNSSDRHMGAVALIKQLSQVQASGVISTHDLDLGKLASEMPNISNACFESRLEGDEIKFDYQLKEGISSSFNACDLMRKMGIDI